MVAISLYLLLRMGNMVHHNIVIYKIAHLFKFTLFLSKKSKVSWYNFQQCIYYTKSIGKNEGHFPPLFQVYLHPPPTCLL